MFLQFSPPVRKPEAPKADRKENEEIVYLTLEPFGQRPKIIFENIVVGRNAARSLIIKNPSRNEISVTIDTSDLPEERQLQLSWITNVIDKHNEVLLILTWYPNEPGSWLHTFRVQYGLKKIASVTIVLKSVAPEDKNRGKKGKGKIKKLPSFVSKKTAPVHHNALLKNKSPEKRVLLPENKNIQLSINQPKSRGKENLLKESYRSNDRRETYILQSAYTVKNSDSLKTTYTTKNNDSFKNPSYTNLTPDTSIEKKLQTFLFSPVDTGEATFDISSHHSIEDKLKPNTRHFQFNRELVVLNGAITMESKILSLETEANNFESPIDSLKARRILSNCSTPATPNLLFSPALCSTEEKSVSDSYRPHGQKKSLFSNSSRETNISTETYIKHNLSSETYTKENLSSETYTKCNISSDTFSKEVPSPRDSLDTIEVAKSSPLFPKIKVDFWNDLPARESHFDVKPLIPIDEESFLDVSTKSVCLKRKSDIIFEATTPSKRPYFGGERISDWSKRNTIARKVKKSSGISIIKGDTVEITSTYTIEIKNPFLFSILDVDPFRLSSYLENVEFLDQLENDFKKYLNALLIPSMFSEKEQDGFSLNVEKLLKGCKSQVNNQENTVQTQKIKSQSDLRLTSFRKKALCLYHSDDIQAVIRKINFFIDEDKLRIRDDKDLHLNLTLQTEIISIILSYNPIWLKIVFEIIFGKPAHFNSNSELTSYLLENFFKNKFLLNRHKSIHSPKYKIYIKKFMLKKFLILVYFLDQAKLKTIISHNPCLFRRNAAIKDSREALLKFSRDTLFAVGDITKQLKYIGYIVSHKQTYIDEFDYTVKCLGVDLRDGVRLTRLLEILTLETKITKNLRVPAISRLQKVHNTKIVFDVLNESNFQILYNIIPEDLVDGHREKTLSFLWQIFYKFQAPLLVKNATIIQKWWRSDAVAKKRNYLRDNWIKKNSAASKLQKWYRRQQLAKKLNHLIYMGKLYATNVRKHRAAIIIQKNIRMFIEKRNYQCLRKMIISLQTNIKKWLVKHDYEIKRSAAIIIQRRYRAILKMKLIRKEFLQKKWAAITIQNWYRGLRLAKTERIRFLAYRRAALVIHEAFRAWKLAKIQKSHYVSLRKSCIVIQRRFRALKQMKIIREEYLNYRWATLLIQQRYRAYRVGQMQRNEFCAIRQAAFIIQSRYRAIIKMRQEFNYYIKLKSSAIFIQRLFRANRARNQAVMEYSCLRESTIYIQLHYRAWKSMIIAHRYYKKLKWAAIVIQRRYRARQVGIVQRNQFLSIRNSAIFLQTRYRATMLMKRELYYYQKLKISTILIQRYFRAKIHSRRIRQDYLNLRNVVIFVQNIYRAKLLERKIRHEHNAAIILQRRFRARREMIRCRCTYEKLKQAAIVIQQRFRAKQISSLKRQEFMLKRNACITIQRHFKAYILMKKQFIVYTQLKQATIYIQTRFRANILAKTHRENYLVLKKTTISVQRHFRQNKLARIARINYTNMRVSSIKIQRWYRSIKKMEEIRLHYCQMKVAAIRIQAAYRKWIQRKKYLVMRRAATIIQTCFRANAIARATQSKYLHLLAATIYIQRKFRAKKQKQDYQRLRTSVIFIQQKYRSIRLMREQRNYFLKLQKTVRIVQERWRGKLLMRKIRFDFDEKLLVHRDYWRKVKAVVKIQAFWRGYRTRSKQSEMNEIRTRLQKAIDEADAEETLAKRYEKSFKRLSDVNCTLQEVLKELENIDYITRRCKDLCLRMSTSLPAVMFSVLAATARSDPEIGINTAATNVLINFCKYDLTRAACWLPSEMNKVLSLMLHFCDKEYKLFPTLCTFLWLLAHTEEYKQGIKNCEGFTLKMSKIEAQCLRKEKMAKNSTKRNSLFVQYKTLPLPSLTSDWGLLYTQKLYRFGNSIQAFKELKRILS